MTTKNDLQSTKSLSNCVCPYRRASNRGEREPHRPPLFRVTFTLLNLVDVILFGSFSFLSTSFLPSLVANIIAIPLEKSSSAQTYSLQVAQRYASPCSPYRYTSPTKDFCPYIRDVNCFHYSLEAFVTRFIYGWVIHAGFSFISAFPVLVIRKPSKLFSVLLKDVNHLKFGAFLASMAVLYRVSSF